MVSCFDKTTVMAQPWAEAGHECHCVDAQHESGVRRDGNILRIGCDVRDWLPPRGEIAFASFFPPCTNVSVSGARWFRDKGLGRLVDALSLFDWSLRIAEWCGCPYMIENPVSVVSTYWREPDYMFHPYHYGDPWTKKTCLWTGGGFVMPPECPVEPWKAGYIHRLPPGPERANIRSATPVGFAKAVFEANSRQTELCRTGGQG